MNIGLFLQLIALAILLVPADTLSVAIVMVAQAFSGVAKDLNKMSAKSAIKTLVDDKQQVQLFRWVAILTGSKNALKGCGFFLGGLLLSILGFQGAILSMLITLIIVFFSSMIFLKSELGKAKNKPKFKDVFSKSRPVNILSAARLFLFASRDVWFVIALPVYLASEFGWSHWWVGGFISIWIIGYGIVQSIAPRLIKNKRNITPDGRTTTIWVLLLAVLPGLIAIGMGYTPLATQALLVGLLIFGIVFAVNSALHSYLIVSYAKEDGVSLDVGFYYMANAMGRLIGTLLSGWLFQFYGFTACLWVSSIMLGLTFMISFGLPQHGASEAIDSK
jgi:predicted MFS family arabinose efflux permease